jgi:hypothetical protein
VFFHISIERKLCSVANRIGIAVLRMGSACYLYLAIVEQQSERTEVRMPYGDHVCVSNLRLLIGMFWSSNGYLSVMANGVWKCELRNVWFSVVGIGGIFSFMQRVSGGESRSVSRLGMFLSIFFGVLQNSRGVGCPLVAQTDCRRV